MDNAQTSFLNHTTGHLNSMMRNMLKHPQMYVGSAVELESNILGLFEVQRFVNEDAATERDLGTEVAKEWMEFAKDQIGYRGNMAVADYMDTDMRLDSRWKTLSRLLAKFCKIDVVI